MSSDFSDPVEFTGGDHAQRADHVPTRKAAPVKPPVPAPEPVVVADEVVEPNTHLKHAVLRPRLEFEAAAQEVLDAQAEDMLAKRLVVEAETAETDALTYFLSLQTKPDQDTLLRDAARRSLEERAENVKAGRPPGGLRTPTHGNSGLDRAAAQRGRQSPQMASSPLLSNVARRLV